MSEATDEAAAPFVPRARLTVLIDFKSTHAYLAKDATLALEAATGIDTQWLPLTVTHPLSADHPLNAAHARREPVAASDRGARHRRIRARYYEQDLRRYVAWRGLPVTDVYPDCDSTLSGLGLLWLADAQTVVRSRYVNLMFDSYFGKALDLDRVRGAVDEAGGDGAAFATFAQGEGPIRFAQLQASLRAAGYGTSPTYVLDGEQFQGRQHLPLLRRLVQVGRTDALR